MRARRFIAAHEVIFDKKCPKSGRYRPFPCFFILLRHSNSGLQSGWMAERSKAPVSGTGLFGGVGSNPTPITFSRVRIFFHFCTIRIEKLGGLTRIAVVAQLGERQTEDLKVPGSIPGLGIWLVCQML